MKLTEICRRILKRIEGTFSDVLFNEILKEHPKFPIVDISEYAKYNYSKGGGYTEAYGDTPGKNALIFKRFLENAEKRLID